MTLTISCAQRYALLNRLQSLLTAQVGDGEAIASELWEIPLHVVEEYLPQVASVCLTHHLPKIRDLLLPYALSLAGRSLQLALRLSWIVDSLANSVNACDMDEQLKTVQDGIESYAINQMQHPAKGRDLSEGSLISDPVSKSGNPVVGQETHETALRDGSTAREYDDVDTSNVWRKEARLRLFNDQRNFVRFLTDISGELRCFSDRSQRKQELQGKLRVLNNRLHGMCLMHPIGASDDPVHWIVNIVVEECAVFSSRERAPYMLRYEVIVDDTTTMADPTSSRLRLRDGRFYVSPSSTEVLEPACVDHLNNGSHMLPSETDSQPFRLWSSCAGVLDNAAAQPLSGDNCMLAVFGELSSDRAARVRRTSQWGSHPNWSLRSVMVKEGDDMRQEELALQLIRALKNMWIEAGLTCSVHPYTAVPTGADCGLLEVVEDANTIDGVKKACCLPSLDSCFTRLFHHGHAVAAYLKAQRRFIESVAGYSVATYILQAKDRHNGNLMLTRGGDLVHIDFGFLCGMSPGGLHFESAPFKLSQELLEVMGGIRSDTFNYYKLLVYQAMEVAREWKDDLVAMLAVMAPCRAVQFLGLDPDGVISQLRSRFRDDLASGVDYALYTRELITNSADNWRTRRYDQFQALQNGIL